MRLLTKLILIFFVIVSFSAGILYTSVSLFRHDYKYLILAIIFFICSNEINEDIIENEEISELDEEF